MKNFLHLVTVAGGVLLCSLASAQSYTGSPSLSESEARQLSQDMSPQARAQLARREAYAAYNEAMSACKSMEQAERKGCAAEAKKNLRNDLAYAKEIRASGTSMGGSRTGSGTQSSGGVSGANDLSSAGGSGAIGTSGTSGGNGAGAGSATGSGNGSSGNGSSGASASGSMSGASGAGLPSGRQGAQQMSGMSNDSSQASAPITEAEKKQFVQSFTPQAQYKLSTREAHAAYAEALKACKEMDRAERSACTKDARATLKQDLAYAKRKMQESSGTSGNSDMSGTSGSESATSGSGSR